MTPSENRPRLILELSLIERSGGASVAELMQITGVTKRTLFRDLLVLSQGETPIYHDRSARVYKLLNTSPVHLLTLSLDEASALYHCIDGLCRSNQPLRTLLRKTQDKLLDAVAPELRPEFQSHPQAVDLQLVSLLIPCDPKVYEPVYTAILKRHCLQLRYYAKSQSETRTRKFDPYSITDSGHAWYVIGFCHLEQDLEILRLDRMSDVTELDETFELPEDFSLESFFDGSWNIEQGRLTHVKLKIAPKAAHLIRAETYHSSQKIEDFPDGSLLFSVTVLDTREISRFILGIGEGIEVLAPLSLRKQIREQAKKIAESNR